MGTDQETEHDNDNEDTEEAKVEVKESIYLTEVDQNEDNIESAEDSVHENNQDDDTTEIAEESQQTLETVSETTELQQETVISSEETENVRSELIAACDPVWTHQWVCAGEKEAREEDTIIEGTSLLTHVVVGNDVVEEGTSLVAHMAQENNETSSM